MLRLLGAPQSMRFSGHFSPGPVGKKEEELPVLLRLRRRSIGPILVLRRRPRPDPCFPRRPANLPAIIEQ